MTKCPNCGYENNDLTFCIKCGKTLHPTPNSKKDNIKSENNPKKNNINKNNPNENNKQMNENDNQKNIDTTENNQINYENNNQDMMYNQQYSNDYPNYQEDNYNNPNYYQNQYNSPDSYVPDQYYNQYGQPYNQKIRNKDKWIALILAIFIPGSGHMYLGKWLKGVVIFFIELFTGLIVLFSLFLPMLLIAFALIQMSIAGLIYLIVYLYQVYNAYTTTERVNYGLT